MPDWEVDPQFKNDVFTFVRVRYNSWGRRGGGWATDYPDSDLNFSFRLQQLTSLKVNPNPIILRADRRRAVRLPVHLHDRAGRPARSREEEVAALRRYLLNGGFLMVDDFWGDDEWENFYERDQARLPRPRAAGAAARARDLPLRLRPEGEAAGPEHPRRPARPRRRASPGRRTATTRETSHYKGIFDDKGRMMAIICHNTDLGDGWEREGEDEWYFHEFSEKKSYPMGINIVTYAMTH